VISCAIPRVAQRIKRPFAISSAAHAIEVFVGGHLRVLEETRGATNQKNGTCASPQHVQCSPVKGLVSRTGIVECRLVGMELRLGAVGARFGTVLKDQDPKPQVSARQGLANAEPASDSRRVARKRSV